MPLHFRLVMCSLFGYNAMMKWQSITINRMIQHFMNRLYQCYRLRHANHPFWIFYCDCKQYSDNLVKAVIQGHYQMQPMIGYRFYGHCEAFSSFQDVLVQKILYRIIKPTFKAIISSTCRHLSGPNQIKHITHEITQALTQQDYRFVIRTDIKSYYASIGHHLLKK